MLPATSVIPIHDENPTRSFSYLAAALIAVNAVLLFMEPGLGMGDSPELVSFFYRWGMVPWEIAHGQPVTGEALRASGIPVVGCTGPCIPGKNVYLALLTSMFLHGGILHVGGNMLFLWVFGNNIEDTLGRVRFILFYLVTGVLAGLAHVAFNSGSVIPTVGASGAVAGLLGAYIVLFPRARITSIVPIFFFYQFLKLPAVVVLGLWFVSQFLIGAGQQLGGAGVAWMAHVGGFAAGAVLILLLGGRGLVRRGTTGYGYGGDPW